jgi:hypothetical protein
LASVIADPVPLPKLGLTKRVDFRASAAILDKVGAGARESHGAMRLGSGFDATLLDDPVLRRPDRSMDWMLVPLEPEKAPAFNKLMPLVLIAT